MPGDTVVLNWPDNGITTTAGTVGPALGVKVPVLTDADIAPFDPMAARNKVGFNSTVLQSYNPGRIHQNLAGLAAGTPPAWGAFSPFIDFTTQKLNGSPTTSSGD